MEDCRYCIFYGNRDRRRRRISLAGTINESYRFALLHSRLGCDEVSARGACFLRRSQISYWVVFFKTVPLLSSRILPTRGGLLSDIYTNTIFYSCAQHHASPLDRPSRPIQAWRRKYCILYTTWCVTPFLQIAMRHDDKLCLQSYQFLVHPSATWHIQGRPPYGVQPSACLSI